MKLSKRSLLATASLGACGVLISRIGGLTGSARGQSLIVDPETTITVNPAISRSPGQMLRAEGRRRVDRPAADAVMRFRPTISDDDYRSKKKDASGQQTQQRQGANAPSRASTLAPAGVLGYIEGAQEVDGLVPPDTHGAIGRTEFVEVTNSHIDIYSKSDPTIGMSIAQSSFFGYTTKVLFDARAMYDSVADRWIIMTHAFAESPTVQQMLVAISTGSSAFGSFLVYNINVAFNAGDFWDFPQIGQDQGAIIFTANVYRSDNSFRGADMFAVPKALLYSGAGFSVQLYTGLAASLAPTIVLDANPTTYLLEAPSSGSALQMYSLTNSGNPSLISLTGPVAVPVPAYGVPPSASQPGQVDPTTKIDTGDSRFANASTQIGDSVWNAHTINVGGLPTPKFYQVSPSTVSVVQSDIFFASGTSNDFNTSIAANANNDVFVTWNSTDPTVGTFVEIRAAGSVGNGGAGFAPGAGVVLVGSTAALTGNFDPRFGLQRWGDYSAVSIDPDNPVQAWVVNEKVNGASTWGSGIGIIG